MISLLGSPTNSWSGHRILVMGTLRQFAARQWRVRSWGQTSHHRRNGMTGEFDPIQTSEV
jgi:hypothetical protein